MESDHSVVGLDGAGNASTAVLATPRIRPQRPESRFNEARILAAILILGFILRALPILWGVPTNQFVRDYHPDEQKVLDSILHFPEIYWTTKAFPGYGTAVQYVIGTALLPVKLTFGNSPDQQQSYFIVAKLFSRFASVALGTASIFLTFLLTRRLYDGRAALLSALFLSTSFFHVLNSPLITLDVSTSFWVVANFLLAFRAVEENRIRDYAWLGVATGLMLGTKTTLGLFFVTPVFLSFLRVYFPSALGTESRVGFSAQAKLVVIWLSVAAVVFVVLHPHIFLDFEKYIDFYAREKRDWVDRTRVSLWELTRIWPEETFRATGAFYAVLGLLGCLTMGKNRWPYKVTIIGFLVLYYGFWRWKLSPRYVITVAPLICVFAGSFVSNAFRRRDNLVRLAVAITVVIGVGHSLYICASGIESRTHDTRTLASRYIHETIPAGALIGIAAVSDKYRWTTHAWRYPRIDLRRYRVLKNFLADPEFLIVRAGDSDRILRTIESGKLLPGYVLPEIHHKDWYRYSAPSPRILKFFDDLMLKKTSPYELVKTFTQKVDVPIEFSPPEIRIYRRRQAKN